MDTPLLLYISYVGAFFMLLSTGIACGVAGAMLRTRSMHLNQLALEDRVAQLEGQMLREVKARAGRERWNKKNEDPLETALLEQVKTPAQPVKKYNWWETALPRSFNGKNGSV